MQHHHGMVGVLLAGILGEVMAHQLIELSGKKLVAQKLGIEKHPPDSGMTTRIARGNQKHGGGLIAFLIASGDRVGPEMLGRFTF